MKRSQLNTSTCARSPKRRKPDLLGQPDHCDRCWELAETAGSAARSISSLAWRQLYRQGLLEQKPADATSLLLAVKISTAARLRSALASVQPNLHATSVPQG